MGLVLGPIIGGVIVHFFSWKWTLLADLFIALSCLILFVNYSKTFQDMKIKEKIDWLGFFLLIIFSN